MADDKMMATSKMRNDIFLAPYRPIDDNDRRQLTPTLRLIRFYCLNWEQHHSYIDHFPIRA